MTKQNNSPNGFTRFGLHATILRNLKDAGFENPRPIQEAAIDAVIEGRDVLGLAQTGTGKTAAFALPIIDRVLSVRPRATSVLVLAPTRELANQINEEFRLLGAHSDLKTTTIYGGVPMGKQIHALKRRPDVIVGCPGRVLDLMQQGALRLENLETLVLDEADHMFDMGFLPVIRKIIERLPQERQNLFFSATMPKQIRHLADDMLYQPHVVELAHGSPAETIEHAVCMIDEREKHDLLDQFLDDSECSSAIVFTRTKHRARNLAKKLSARGRRSVALQGNMSQAQRDKAMRGFREGTFDILVATDIAARGIDVEAVSYVINFDVPNTPEAYSHRIGRTGRSERTGKAFTFVTRADNRWLRDTERKLGDRIQRAKVPAGR